MLKVNYIINTVFTSRTYILSTDDSNDYWIVDCGDVEPLIEKISQLSPKQFNIKGVLLTHAHYDHIYGLPHLTRLFPDIKVYTNEFGKKSLANERINMSRYHEDPINYSSENVIECPDSCVIDLFDGVNAVVYYTPGHNPSCITFVIGDYLFTGDAYIPGIDVVANLPYSNKEQVPNSLEKIKALALGRIVCSGHEV